MSLWPSITAGNETIEPKDKARNIGVTFDTTLTMSHHVNDVVKGAFYHLRNIAKIRKYISEDITEVLIHAFVSSKLDFCNSPFTVSRTMKIISYKMFRMRQPES